jgi:dipeptidyl aminopeptidase/acylaminoacyl peptidase
MAKRKVVAEDLLAIKLVGDPQVSPDGSKCVFTVKTIDGEKNRYLSHLWMADLTNGEVRQFTFGEVSDAAPRWSPDGTQIAFVRTDLREKRSQIWLIRADGGEAWQLTKLDEGSIGEPVGRPTAAKLLSPSDRPIPTGRRKRERNGKRQASPIRHASSRGCFIGWMALAFWTCANTFGSAM